MQIPAVPLLFDKVISLNYTSHCCWNNSYCSSIFLASYPLNMSSQSKPNHCVYWKRYITFRYKLLLLSQNVPIVVYLQSYPILPMQIPGKFHRLCLFSLYRAIRLVCTGHWLIVGDTIAIVHDHFQVWI